MKKVLLIINLILITQPLVSQKEKYYIIKKRNERKVVVFYHNFNGKKDSLLLNTSINIDLLDKKKWYQAILDNDFEDSCLVSTYLLFNYPDKNIEKHAIFKNWSKETIELIIHLNSKKEENEKNAVSNSADDKKQDSLRKYYNSNINKLLQSVNNIEELDRIRKYTSGFGGLISSKYESRINLEKIIRYLSNSDNPDFKKYLFDNRKEFECRELDTNCKVLIQMIYQDIIRRREYNREDMNNILKFNFYTLKDSLYQLYPLVEKKIIEEPYNFAKIEWNNYVHSLSLIHIALAKFGDKKIEELVYQRIDNSKYNLYVRDDIQTNYIDIGTKKSLQRALVIAKKQRREYIKEVEEREKEKGDVGICGTRREHSILSFLNTCNEKQELFSITPKNLQTEGGEYAYLSENLKIIDYYIEQFEKYIKTLK